MEDVYNVPALAWLPEVVHRIGWKRSHPRCCCFGRKRSHRSCRRLLLRLILWESF